MYTSKNTGYATMNTDDVINDLRSYERSHRLYSDLQMLGNSTDFEFRSFTDIKNIDDYKFLLGEFAYKGCKLIGEPTRF